MDRAQIYKMVREEFEKQKQEAERARKETAERLTQGYKIYNMVNDSRWLGGAVAELVWESLETVVNAGDGEMEERLRQVRKNVADRLIHGGRVRNRRMDIDDYVVHEAMVTTVREIDQALDFIRQHDEHVAKKEVKLERAKHQEMVSAVEAMAFKDEGVEAHRLAAEVNRITGGSGWPHQLDDTCNICGGPIHPTDMVVADEPGENDDGIVFELRHVDCV